MIRLMVRFTKWLVLSVLLVSLILVSSISALMFFEVTIDLGFLKDGVTSTAQSLLDRDVTIDGPVALEFSSWPALEIGQVAIANSPAGSEPLFFSAGRARVQIGVFPLLKGDIAIAEIHAEEVTLNLEHDENGAANWEFGSPAESAEDETSRPETTAADDKEPFFSLSGIDNLSFNNIALSYHDAALDRTVAFTLAEMQGSAAHGEPVHLSLNGQLQEYPYLLILDSDPLDSLLSRTAQSWQFTVQGEAVGKQVAISGDYDKATIPEANLGFQIDEVDVGAILEKLGLVEGIEASTGSMDTRVTLRGDNLNEIVQQSSLSFSVRDGSWRIKSPTSDAFFDVENLSGDILVKEGNAVTMNLGGMVDTLPVDFVITGAPLVDYVIEQESIPLAIEAHFANSTIGFGGELSLPITNRELDLFMKFRTDSLENFNDLLGINLPPIGPLDFSTAFHLSGKHYEMTNLDLMVGDSQLTGMALLDPSREIPLVKVELISEMIQLDDFQGIIEALPESKVDNEPDGNEPKTTEESDPAERKNILSREVISTFNAELLVQANEVFSGADRLGAGTLKMGLQDSFLSVDPLQVEVPGGGVDASFDYLPGADDVTVNVKADIEEFDVGVLIRRKKPQSDMGGLLFMDASLHSQAPDLRSIMEHAEGHFDFGFVPRNFSAGIIDLWAVNLISAIMTEVSDKEQSEINCFVVRLDVDDGIMAEKAIYMDTSNMHIRGKAAVDFGNRTLKIMMVPKAKKPEFFSLAVPIKLEGAFDDFGLGIGLSRLTGAVVSFITSPLHVPIRRIFANEIPEDGQEACRQAWSLTEEDPVEK